MNSTRSTTSTDVGELLGDTARVQPLDLSDADTFSMALVAYTNEALEAIKQVRSLLASRPRGDAPEEEQMLDQLRDNAWVLHNRACFYRARVQRRSALASARANANHANETNTAFAGWEGGEGA